MGGCPLRTAGTPSASTGRLDFYYDGVLVGSVRDGVTGTPHHLIVNLAVSGQQVEEESLRVDYVRLWKRG